jgi:hypothetical protein
MWKAIKNVASAVADLTVIAGKEVQHQVSKASDSTESVTSKLSAKAATIRTSYEQHLEERKLGVKSEVVTDTPSDVVAIN